MERSIRIGKDFNVRWSINKVVDGERQPYELAGKELVLQYRTPYGLKEATEWRVVGNTIVWTFRGKEQKALGSYELILTENGGKDGMVTVDTCRAFKLVAHSCEETEGSGSDIVIEDVVLESEVAFAALRGPQGERGPEGPQGPQGPQGERGPQGEQGLFIAVYNETSLEEIQEAFSKKMTCVCLYVGNYYLLSEKTDNKAIFRGFNGDKEYYQLTRTTKQWLASSSQYESTMNKTQSISENSTSTQYPSAKAVYEALQNVGGGEGSYDDTEIQTKLTELSEETKKLYFTEGTVIDNSENDSDILSRSSFIPVNLGDVITSSIFRIKKYDAFRIYISDDLTSIQTPSLSEIVDYTITDEKCKFIRIVVGRGKESVILKNGLPYLPYKEIEADFGGNNSKVYPFKPITLEQYEANNLLGKNALNNRSAINGAILGLWVKNPEENTTYHLTQFRYRQVSSDWGSTEYSAIRIARKSASTETDIILEDRKSQTITEEIQIFNTEKYLVIVDWSKTTKGFGYAEGATAYNEMSDVILQRNNTEYLTMLGFNFGESTEEKPLKIVANGQQFESVDGVIELPMAGTSSLGLMSSADKRKLDGLQQGNIEIHGSGIAKNASAFGFLPTNDGTTNANNLQSCVNGGGTIIVDLVGTYSIAKSIMLDSDTKLIFGKGVKVSLVEENGSSPKYPFINRGALTEEYNENIAIEGLHIVTNGIQGNDITSLPGQRGYIAMKRIKNLTLRDIKILDVPNGWYTIHIQQFYNINLEHIHVEGMKDGIHLGVGKKFRIAHCLFKTNDDSIALNAHDYPSGTSEFGWIEDGIIEDITILPTPSGNMSRGVYALGGAWTDWKSGNSYQPLGDACVSNNGVYVTMGARSTQKIVSTQQPNHASGKLTYSDGLTWIRLDNQSAQYDAGVRNISVRDLHIASDGRVATFNLDNDDFSNSLYEGCAAPIFENITFENVRQDEFAQDSVFVTYVPFSNLRLNNFDLKVGFRGISTEKLEKDTYSGKCSLLISGMALYQNSIVFIKNDRGQRNLDVKMIGTMIIHNSTSLPTIYGSSTVNIVSDIELGKN